MKTNKTKPIKKLMIFTIITVMIVSLFAVPAFAFTMIAPTGTFTLPSSLSSETSLIGGYKVTYNFSTLTGELRSFANNASEIPTTVSVSVFGTDGADKCFFATRSSGQSLDSLIYNECTSIVYSHGADVIRFYNDSSTPVETLYTDSSVYQVVLLMDEITKSNWEADSDGFMDSATYTVSTIVSASSPDPEEPDNPTPPADGEEQGIFAVWSKITQWIVQGLASVSNAFYADGKLTLLGTLCIIPVALGIAFLLIAIIQKFLRLRG